MNAKYTNKAIKWQIRRPICSVPYPPRPQAARAICAANCRGFTIVELLGVLTILAILIAMLMSGAGLVQRRTQQYHAEASANALVQAVLHYRQVYGTWPCELSRTNASLFVAGVGSSNLSFFSTTTLSILSSPDVDQAAVIAALSPDSAANPRRIQFLTIATNALQDGRLFDPWGHPYLLLMDIQCSIYFNDLAFSNLDAVAISAGPPVANPGVDNWIFSTGVRP